MTETVLSWPARPEDALEFKIRRGRRFGDHGCYFLQMFDSGGRKPTERQQLQAGDVLHIHVQAEGLWITVDPAKGET